MAEVNTTIKELIEGTTLQEILVAQSDVQDPLDAINLMVEYVDTRHIIREIDVDTNVISTVDNYGNVVDDAQDQNIVDRTYTGDKYDIPNSKILSFTVPYDQLQEWEITPDVLNSMADQIEVEGSAGDNFRKFSAKINTEVAKMVRRLMVNRRTELETVMAQIGTVGATNYCKPLGLPIAADAADRPNNWNYDNLLGVALDEDSYKLGVNLFATGQKNVYNEKYGNSRPLIVLHASDFTLAESVHLPDLSVNAFFRTPGGSLEQKIIGVKAVGTYGDTAHPNDWIMLGKKHQVKRKAMRSVGGKETLGFSVRAIFLDNGSFRVEVRDRSVVVIDQPIDILKSIVAA